MPPMRFRTRSLILAVAALAIPAAFFRPDSYNDPPFLSVAYCAIIVAGLVQLLIYAISLVQITDAEDSIPGTGGSSHSETRLGAGQEGAEDSGQDGAERR